MTDQPFPVPLGDPEDALTKNDVMMTAVGIVAFNDFKGKLPTPAQIAAAAGESIRDTLLAKFPNLWLISYPADGTKSGPVQVPSTAFSGYRWIDALIPYDSAGEVSRFIAAAKNYYAQNGHMKGFTFTDDQTDAWPLWRLKAGINAGNIRIDHDVKSEKTGLYILAGQNVEQEGQWPDTSTPAWIRTSRGWISVEILERVWPK